jgi:hypothetical protein
MVTKEIIFFEDEGIGGVNPQLVDDCLSTTAPSSVAPERTFSAANTICTTTKSSSKDNTTDCLCFLRAHFIQTGIVIA